MQTKCAFCFLKLLKPKNVLEKKKLCLQCKSDLLHLKDFTYVTREFIFLKSSCKS